MNKPLIYVAGSMSNRDGIRSMTQWLRTNGLETFHDWIHPGEETDIKWREFEESLGHDYFTALKGPHANDVFEFDKHWLDKADAFVLVYPAGKSAHTEMGYMIGKGKPAFVFIEEEPEKWDVMLLFATGITNQYDELLTMLDKALGH